MDTCCLHDTHEHERHQLAARFYELQAAGWQEQVTQCEPDLSEAVGLFRRMGLKVRLEPLIPPQLEGGCARCGKGHCTEYRTVFTHPNH